MNRQATSEQTEGSGLSGNAGIKAGYRLFYSSAVLRPMDRADGTIVGKEGRKGTRTIIRSQLTHSLSMEFSLGLVICVTIESSG